MGATVQQSLGIAVSSIRTEAIALADAALANENALARSRSSVSFFSAVRRKLASKVGCGVHELYEFHQLTPLELQEFEACGAKYKVGDGRLSEAVGSPQRLVRFETILRSGNFEPSPGNEFGDSGGEPQR